MARKMTNTEQAFQQRVDALNKAGYDTKVGTDLKLYFRRKATYTSDGGWTEARSIDLIGIIPQRYI